MLTITLEPYHCSFECWTPAHGKVFQDRFVYDTETTLIDDTRPYLTPSFIIASVCNGEKGFFLTRDTVLPFFEAHANVEVICHNASFDLKVTQRLFGNRRDLYALVENGKVWDTMILKRLLSLATAGHPARGQASLADCVKVHLGIDLSKEVKDASGKQVRTSFDQYLGRPFSSIPEVYLRYASTDSLATWHLFVELHRLIKATLASPDVTSTFGYVDNEWLKTVTHKFGPLTHHTQLKASIVVDELRSNGIAIDQVRQEEKAIKVRELLKTTKERLRLRGYLAGESGSSKALQSILSQLKRKHPDLELKHTASGKGWSTKEEDLADLAREDPFFTDYFTYRAAEKLLSTYLRKMGQKRLHPKFGYLLQTGRTYCSGGFNLQNLPREKDETDAAATIRGCFVPGDKNVFIDSDFGQIELVVLGHVLDKQLRLGSTLADLVNTGQDVHRLIASKMLGKEPGAVKDDERNSVKPISFGRPGGMGSDRLRRVAKNGYGIDLTTEQVEERIQAYHKLCPELDAFLDDEIDLGLVIAQKLHITPRQYDHVLGRYISPQDREADLPQSWLGSMLLKVMHEKVPVTRYGAGRPYTQAEIDFFWQKAQSLSPEIIHKPDLVAKLQARTPHKDLWEAIRNWAGRRPVFTLTGRLRANTTFCSSRNTLFQGTAADGAILALWKVWRAGYKLVDFVHDQLVVEAPADDKVFQRKADIERLMREGMLEVVPGMTVKVETVVTRSLHKKDEVPEYTKSQHKEVTTNESSHQTAA